MSKYLIKRILHGIFSVIVVVMIVMLLVYTAVDKTKIFQQDPMWAKRHSNDKIAYEYQCWEDYGYLDYVPYADWLGDLVKNGKISEETRVEAVKFGATPADDSDLVKKYVEEFKNYYEGKGYTVQRVDAIYQTNSKTQLVKGGVQKYFAYKNISVFVRMFKYFTTVVRIDNIHNAKGDVGERGLKFVAHDPAYGGTKFSPAIMGNGTTHRYLLYFDNQFPYIHQNLITVNLGMSYTIRKGVDVWDVMIQPQGSNIKSKLVYPETGYTEESAKDLHSARYMEGSSSGEFEKVRFTSDYTEMSTIKDGFSKMGYSFLIGIISTFIAYFVGIPLGIAMSRNQNKLVDKIGTVYIVFIMAVPSLAYIFMFRAIGLAFGWPITFDSTPTAYILPIVSVSLPSIGGLMKWSRRYMIDQKNSDYVKFARSGGLSEPEIFRGHILKNAMIIIVHGIPGTVLFSLIGGIVTERVYPVPGTGGMLVNAITFYDNAATVGVAMFYALLSVTSLILGDVLMSMVDPRISFTSKGR